jgi:hypothetical protein
MKAYSAFVAVVVAALFGIAMAFIRPAQPVQVVQYGPVVGVIGLDNPGIPESANIHPARKCTYQPIQHIFLIDSVCPA